MNYLIDISYDGSKFHGWAKQLNTYTVQGEIEKILSKIYKQKIYIYGSGRTDTGVHAMHQFFNFHERKIHLNKLQLFNSLNGYFPKTIKVNEIFEVNKKFNARTDARSKTYIYFINTGSFDLFKDNYLLNYNKKINIKKIKDASSLFVGKHNFLSFSKSILENNIRVIKKISIWESQSIVNIEILGTGFLRNMVRMIIGSLIDINENKKEIKDIKKLLNNPLKGSSQSIVSPNGLYLKKVEYLI